MRLSRALAVVVFCAACSAHGGSPSGDAVRPEVAAPEDPAAPLSRLLPRGADRCTLARPAQLSTARRALYAQVARSDALAWAADVPILAFASAERERRRDAPAMVMFLRLDAGDDPGLRRLLSERSGLDLRWDGTGEAACTPEACPTRARFEEADLVRIERGDWPHVEREGAEVACRRLLAAEPGALELSASRRRDGGVGRKLGLPLRSTSIVVALERGARLSRNDLMLGGEQAELLVAAGEASPVGRPFGDLTVGLVRSRRDAVVHTEAEVLWEDLQLGRDDVARQAKADDYADALERIVDAEDVDFGDAAEVVAQAQYRVALVAASTAPDASPLVAEARAFLGRALEALPGNAELEAVSAQLQAAAAAASGAP